MPPYIRGEPNKVQGHQRRIYTTFILGTALLNFGPRADNFGHGPLDFFRANANFSARVPKNLGGPRPPLEVVLMDKNRSKSKMASSSLVEPLTPRKIQRAVTWSEEATIQLIEIWGDETIQFSLDAAKTSKESAQVYKTVLVSDRYV